MRAQGREAMRGGQRKGVREFGCSSERRGEISGVEQERMRGD